MAKYSYSEGTYSGKGNIQIAYRGWEADKPKGVLVLIHGIGDHSGRYTRLIDALSGKKISIFAPDLRGHGKSQGERGHVNSFLDYIFDLKIFMNMIREAHSDLPVVMLGQGLGGAVVCRYALTYQNDIKGIVLASPSLTINSGMSMITRAATPVLNVFTPRMEIECRISPQTRTHDEEEISICTADSLVHNIITPRLLTEIIKNGDYCLDRATDIRMPLLVVHGATDTIVPAKISETLFEKSLSDDKQILIAPDLLHETMNETPRERAKILSSIAGWIAGHVTGKEVTIKVKVPKSALKKKSETADKTKATGQTKQSKKTNKPVTKKKPTTKKASHSKKKPAKPSKMKK